MAVSQFAQTRHSKAVSLSTWRPLQLPLFLALRIASLTSNIGTWMHEAGAAWLMTLLTPSPVMVALMQTATTLPIFVRALPAGALADGVDRRRMLMLAQTWMFVAAAALGVLAVANVMTPWLLLSLTFVLSAGAALNAPAWQATVSALVPRADLPSAVALTGMGLNLARAVGPVLGGIVVAAVGAWAVFLLNAVSFASVIAVLYAWRPPKSNKSVPSEPVLNSIRAGIHYARHAPALRAVLVRTGLFVPLASALWALLPVLVRHEMGIDSVGWDLARDGVCRDIGGALVRLLFSLAAIRRYPLNGVEGLDLTPSAIGRNQRCLANLAQRTGQYW